MSEWVKFILTLIAGGGASGLFAWYRSRKKDTADTSKVEADTLLVLQEIESKKVADEVTMSRSQMDFSKYLSEELLKTIERLNQKQTELDSQRQTMQKMRDDLDRLEEQLEETQKELDKERSEKKELLERLKKYIDGNE